MRVRQGLTIDTGSEGTSCHANLEHPMVIGFCYQFSFFGCEASLEMSTSTAANGNRKTYICN